LVTAMVVIILGWSVVTLLTRGGPGGVVLPPTPSLETIHFKDEALGWLKGTRWPQFTLIAFMIAFGHSVLAMSGEETLAQVSREIEHPKLKNLKRTGMVVFVYSLLFTAAVSFLAVMLIPDADRSRYYDNLISGLVMNFSGPPELRLFFQAFV